MRLNAVLFGNCCFWCCYSNPLPHPHAYQVWIVKYSTTMYVTPSMELEYLLCSFSNVVMYLFILQCVFEQEIWLDHLKQSVLKSEALLHSGPKMMRDSTSVVSVHLPREMQRGRRALQQTSSLPTVLLPDK